MEAVQNGCQLILHNLFQDDLIQKHNALAVTILEDLFERNNQVEQNLFGLQPANFKKVEEIAERKTRFNDWCGTSESFLRNLKFDILLIKEVGFSNWKPKLLQQACKLVTVLLKLGEMLVSTLEAIYKKDIKPSSGPNLSNTRLPGGENEDAAEKSVKDVRRTLDSEAKAAWKEVIKHLTEGLKDEVDEHELASRINDMCSIANDAPISGATFRELVLRNGIYHKWQSLIERASQEPVSMEHQGVT